MDPNPIVAHAEDLLRRLSPQGRERARRARARRRKAAARMFRRVVAATSAIFLAMLAYGLFIGPVGFEGIMAAVLAVILSTVAIIAFSRAPEATPEALVQTDLAQLPGRTEEWLERQRPALPAPAARLLDGLGVRLEALAPQLATLNPAEPAAIEVRKLLADDLPELVNGYQRVPQPLRRQARNGQSPDGQLVEGLEVIDSEIARMTAQLASGDLDKLATQGRYLELKYRGDDGVGGPA
jgi:hypothetical protein